MASLPIQVVENTIVKALESGEAIKNGRIRDRWGAGPLREQYAATLNGDTFSLRHWGTEILRLDLDTNTVVRYYGEGNSDRDAVQTALNHFNVSANAHYYPSTDSFVVC